MAFRTKKHPIYGTSFEAYNINDRIHVKYPQEFWSNDESVVKMEDANNNNYESLAKRYRRGNDKKPRKLLFDQEFHYPPLPEEMAWSSNTELSCSVSHNIADFLLQREQNGEVKSLHHLKKCFSTKMMLRKGINQSTINVEKYDKIYCSEWISDDTIVMGTKCKNLLKYNHTTQKLESIALLSDERNKHSSVRPGIHSISLNPSGSLLAASGKYSNEVSVFHVPSFTPVGVFSRGHKDTIFGSNWMDEEHLITVSRDQNLCLWKVREAPYDTGDFIKPIYKVHCDRGRLRNLVFNKYYMEIAIMSSNGLLLVLDARSLTFKRSFYPIPTRANSPSISTSEDNRMYAIGLHNGVSLMDVRVLKPVAMIDSNNSIVRCNMFHGNMLVYGTENGKIVFNDIRQCNGDIYDAKWAKSTVNYHLPPAIFTISSDPSRTKLFSGGGSLPLLSGISYASIWD